MKKKVYLNSKGKPVDIKKIVQVPKKVKLKRIDFIRKKKDEADKFYDITKSLIPQAHILNKYGENVFSKVKYRKLIAKRLKVKESQVKKMQAGNFTKSQIKKINSNHRGFEKLKKVTKKYTLENFTLENFFKVKRNFKLKERHKLIIKAGLNVFYKSPDSGNYMKIDGEYVQVYEVPNVPIPFEFTNGGKKTIQQGIDNFFGVVKEFINRPKERSGILFFYFNYFIVQIVDLHKIPLKDINKKFIGNIERNKVKQQKQKRKK